MKSKKMNAFDGWKLVLYCIIAGSLIPSIFFTVLALLGSGYHWYAKLLIPVGAIVIEGSKIVFPKKAVSEKHWTMKARGISMFFGVCAMVVSLTFSLVFSINENNAVKNEFIQGSNEAVTAKKASTTRDKLMERLEKKIESLETEKNGALKGWGVVSHRSKRLKITNDFNEKIEKVSNKLTEQQNVASEPVETITETSKEIDVALGAVMTANQEKWFFGFLVVFVEFAGLTATIILSTPQKAVKKHYFVFEDDQVDADVGSGGKVIDIDSKNKPVNSSNHEIPKNANGGVSLKKISDYAYKEVDADATKNINDIGLKNTDIMVYVDKMQETKKNTKRGIESRGYQWLSKQTELDEEICRKIKGHLENIGTIKTVGIKTFIL